MSGGVVQLVATGDQDAWLTGKPEVSFFRSNYKRYTHYASSVERQIIQGTPNAAGISTVRFEKKGDLINYVYFTARDGTGALVPTVDWTNVIDKVELLIGGQVIDTHDLTYSTTIEPVTGSQTHNQRALIGNTGNYQYPTTAVNPFYALKFFFCKDWSVSLPLVALQMHDVELRITWASLPASAPTGSATNYNALQYICWTNFVYLDQSEREYFAKTTPLDLLITQVQRTLVPSGSGVTNFEVALAQPVKFLAFSTPHYGDTYVNTSAATASAYQLKTQVNGIDIGEFKHLPQWVDIPQYYHTAYGYLPNGVNTRTPSVGIISYCLDTSKLQPTGTLNFSRIDTFRIVVPTGLASGVATLMTSTYLYAVSYNVLRIQGGLGSLLYAN